MARELAAQDSVTTTDLFILFRIMKNDFCDLDEMQLRELEIPPLAAGLLTSPFQFNVDGHYVRVPVETFKQFTEIAGLPDIMELEERYGLPEDQRTAL